MLCKDWLCIVCVGCLTCVGGTVCFIVGFLVKLYVLLDAVRGENDVPGPCV
jgi:hypothetical protein